MRIFSYCVQTDDGAAPNPYWGYCTLVICKPKIRSTAKVGDWVVGTGSKRTPGGDLSGRVVYVKQVTDRVPMEAYDFFARDHAPGKIPRMTSPDWRRRVGDAIYDFDHLTPQVRPSVHTASNRDRDLGGKHALISDRFWYYGAAAPMLPGVLRGLARQSQGHRSDFNESMKPAFLSWVGGLGPYGIYGKPQREAPRRRELGERNRRHTGCVC